MPLPFVFFFTPVCLLNTTTVVAEIFLLFHVSQRDVERLALFLQHRRHPVMIQKSSKAFYKPYQSG